jgi:curved DNA-binding protein CbpA
MPKLMTITEAMGILKLTKGFSDKDLRLNHRKLARETHPDLGGNSEDFYRVEMAYNTLKDLSSDSRQSLNKTGTFSFKTDTPLRFNHA